ncbi:MAG TPA: ABC transporter substrate-binding protein [Acidimicrobiales bacterium]|nr:ABC transporter substrate-binding protein [Acidimicrobiales bacterium]
MTTSARRHVAVVLLWCALAAACTGVKKNGGSTDLSIGNQSTDTTVAATDPGAGDVTEPADTTAAPDPAAPETEGGAAAGGGAGARGSAPTATKAPAPSGAGGASTSPSGGTASTPVDAPGDPQLFSGAANTHGITPTTITLCGHAALTYGPAFNATADDFNVYYSAVNDAGGIHGRKVVATYENDNYEADTARQAADACRGKKPFAILGGIGFDQIPSVRNWAEANKELYLHHIATEVGAGDKKYSFTTQPSVEQVGRAFGELVASRYPGKKVGALYRDSEFWQPGFNAFKQVAAARGINLVKAVPVQKNQANYTQALIELRNAGAEVAWAWENTLALTQIVKQAKAQNYSPQWVAFPFNLTSQTLDNDALTPPMVGLSSWPGYSFGDYGDTFAPYANDMKEFEAQYRKYRPNTDISGVAGDLLWLNWIEQKRLVELLRACGPNCTRNHFAGLLVNGYKATTSPTCPLDFSRGNNGSGGFVNLLETFRSPSGKVNWKSTALCKTGF